MTCFMGNSASKRLLTTVKSEASFPLTVNLCNPVSKYTLNYSNYLIFLCAVVTTGRNTWYKKMTGVVRVSSFHRNKPPSNPVSLRQWVNWVKIQIIGPQVLFVWQQLRVLFLNSMVFQKLLWITKYWKSLKLTVPFHQCKVIF